MNLFVSSLLLSCCLTFTPPLPDSGKTRCTCRPRPPGGITECQSGQNAICNGRGGECKGSCISVSPELRPLQFSAELLTQLFETKVSVADLEKDPNGSRKMLAEILKLSKNGESAKLTLRNITREVCVGLTDVAKKKLKSAIKALPVGAVYIIPKGKIRW